MARYIDESEIKFTGYTFADVNNEVYVKVEDVRKAIAQTPTADVAEVVRCKDCKHWRTEHGGFCEASNALSEVNNVIPLPCKVGDTVYDISEFFDGTNHPKYMNMMCLVFTLKKKKENKYFILMI